MSANVLQPVATIPRGLSQAEVEARRAKGLGNPPPPATSRTYAQILRENVFTFINGVIFFLGLALFIVGRPTDGFLSVGIISLNILVSVVQEIRAKRTLDKIALLTRPKATVMRDGATVEAAPEELVVGDVLYVAPGDQIVLDGRVLEGKMSVDESALTGESALIPKKSGDEVYSGSFCVNGSAYYVAEKVGSASLANQITAGARAFRRILTPLQQEVIGVVRVMLLVVAFLEFLIILNSIVHAVSISDAVGHSTLIAGLIPNGLFLSISIAYALGAVRIIRFGVLVQQANAIESLSNVTVLCLDKTGTLTTNRLQVDAVYPLTATADELGRVLGDMMANATTLNKTSEAIAEKFHGVRRTVTGEVPFSSALKWSAIAFSDGGPLDSARNRAPLGAGSTNDGNSSNGNGHLNVLHPTLDSGTFALGAPEFLKPYLGAETELENSPIWHEIEHKTQELSEQGLRVLLVAHHPLTELVDHGDESTLPSGMTALGLLSIRDELRGEAQQALENFGKAGVTPKIISGDSPETVAALAKQAGLKNIQLVSGIELEKMNDAQFREAARTANVFGRITPQQKQKLVEALRANGEYVAMIGDGVNDVLSLKQANLGIAMQSGTQATRAVADLVLMEDSFAALAPAVSEGQRIVNGMQDILKLFLTRIATMALFILSALVIGEFPLQLRSAGLVTLFSVGIPTVALALWARPGPIGKGTLGQRLTHFVLTPTIVTTIFALLVLYGVLVGELLTFTSLSTLRTPGVIAPFFPAAFFRAQSTLIAFLIFVGLLTIIFVEPPTLWWTGGDELSGDWKPTLLAGVLFLLFFVIISVRPLRDLFALAALGIPELVVALIAAGIWLFLVRWLWRARIFEKYLRLGLS